MWNRKELKLRGKADFFKNYWPTIGVSFLLSYFINSNFVSFSYKTDFYGQEQIFLELFSVFSFELDFASSVFYVFIFGVISLIISIFVLDVLCVGIHKFFIRNVFENPKMKAAFFPFKAKKEVYWNIVKVKFNVSLSIFLWMFCFIIPGIIKAYEYCMVDYLLAENPLMSSKEAKKTSRAMMDGQKLDTFVLEISFIGWNLLSLFTFGILGILYVSPYINMTKTHLYLTLKENYYRPSDSFTFDLSNVDYDQSEHHIEF